MAAVSPVDGPVAVTGASGYIGSWIVRDLMEQGYKVHACVRDSANPAKVAHLLAMNEERGLRGSVQLFDADLLKPGSYDEAFKGCCAVIHAGATMGHNGETPQQVYDGCFTENQHVLESVKKAGGTVRRFVFTSSFAAVIDPRPRGYVFTEKDWFASYPEGWKGKCTDENIPKIRDIAYAFAKMRTERLAYDVAAQDGSFLAMAINPLHVTGPVMCKNHDQPGGWQALIKGMVQNKQPHNFRMLWNLVDVRDAARAHRLCIESSTAGNGSRYILAAADRSGEMFTWQLQAKLKQLFPHIDEVSGEDMEDGKPTKPTYDAPRSYCLLAMEELGLKPYSVEENLRATIDSYARLGLLTPKAKL